MSKEAIIREKMALAILEVEFAASNLREVALSQLQWQSDDVQRALDEAEEMEKVGQKLKVALRKYRDAKER